MYTRLFSSYRRTTNSSFSSPFKNNSPYGGLLAACLFGFFGIKIVKKKLEEQKLEGYGCRGHPQKYIPKPLKKKEIIAVVTGEC